MATGASEFIDNTTADVFIPEIWSKEAIVARENALLFANLVNRVFEADVKQFGDTIHVPSIGNLTAQTKTVAANAAISYETITETNTNITIGTWEYSAIAIETATKRQVNRDLLERYAPKQGYALALAVDDVLAGLPDNFSQNVGTLAVELSYEDVLRARQYLNDADAPQEGRVIVISPAQEVGFMKLPQFVHGDYSLLHGDKGENRKDRAYLGTWMHTPVYMSVNVEGSNNAGHDNAMFQKEALALVLQMNPTTHTFFDIDYLAHKAVVEQLYGSAEMRDDHGIWMKGA
jgi:hypothetical protein